MPTGAPHNFPENPFVLLVMLVVVLAPLVYLVIAGLLFLIFDRREAARTRAVNN